MTPRQRKQKRHHFLRRLHPRIMGLSRAAQLSRSELRHAGMQNWQRMRRWMGELNKVLHGTDFGNINRRKHAANQKENP